MSVLQAMFSKNFEDLEKLEISAMPMTCRIDFQDHVISQEVLTLVSEWNKGLNIPQYVFPFMIWIRKRHKIISSLIRNTIPIFGAVAIYSLYIKISTPWHQEVPITSHELTSTIQWLVGAAAFLFVAYKIGRYLGGIFDKSLARFGNFHATEITNGDRNRQTKLMARSSRSFWKFIASGSIALLWNILGAIIAFLMLRGF